MINTNALYFDLCFCQTLTAHIYIPLSGRKALSPHQK